MEPTEPQTQYSMPTPEPGKPSKITNKKYTAIGLAVLLVLVVGLAVVLKSNNNSKTKTNQAQEVRQATIQITAQGYLPQELTVKKGTEITWVNADSSPHKLVPNTAGTSTETNKGLESQDLGPGQSHTYTANTTGSYNYYDNANPTATGTITVED